MTKRNDAHCPVNFDPVDYEWVGPFYQGGNIFEILASRNPWMQKIRETLNSNPFHGNHYDKGTCDMCGTNFAYGEVYKHVTTGQYVCVGHICAAKAFGCSDKMDFQHKNLKKQVAGIRISMKQKELAETFIIDNDLAETFKVDHHIIKDIHNSLMKYGRLTERQVAFAKKLAKETVERKANEVEEKANAKPVIVGKGIVITGIVLAQKWQESHYGDTLKMLVKDDRGFKVYGTVPSALDCERGDKVVFTANVEASKDDETFGFFKRPRASKVVAEGAE